MPDTAATDPRVIGASGTRTTDSSFVERHFAMVVTGVTIAVFGLHLWLSRDVPGPAVILDEAGYLGNARWLSGTEPTFRMPVTPYYGFGYSLVLAPLHRVIDDPATLWRAALTVNAALLATLVPLLSAFARRVLDAWRTVALGAALVGALVPAATAAGASVLSENLSLPLVVVVVLAAHRTAAAGPALGRVWLAPSAALLYATHPRFTPVVVVVGLTLVAGALLRWIPPAIAGINLALLAVLSAATARLKDVLVEARWSDLSLEGRVGDVVDLARTGDGLQRLAEAAIGQAWYLAVGSLGLAVVGVIVLGRVAAPDRHRRRGSVAAPAADVEEGAETAATAPGPAPSIGSRVAAVVLLASALGVFAISVGFFARTQFRADHLVYGRHNDCFAPLWVAAALAFLLRPPPRRQALTALAGAAVTTAGLAVATWVVVDPLSYGGTYAYFAVPAISRFLEGAAQHTFTRASLGGLAGLGLIAVVVLVVRRPWLLVLPLVLWTTWTGMGRIDDVERFSRATYGGWHLPEQVADLGIDRVALNADETKGQAVMTYQFWMPDVRFDLYEPKLGEEPTGPFVLSSVSDPQMLAVGARIALLDEGGFYGFRETPEGMALWVRPGPEQDRLAEEGALLPAGFPTALPDEARAADLRLLDGLAGQTLRVRSGGRVAVRLAGAHEGAGSPWPDVASYSRDGRVRVIAHVEPLDPDGIDGLPTGGELPRWILPGERFTTDAAVHALGAFFVPLPPGRYRVTFGIGQEGYDWFTSGGEDATFTLDVRDG